MASVIGLGFVGSAMLKSFEEKNVSPLYGYDKYKNGGIGTLTDCLNTPIIFLCLPTPFDENTCSYDKQPIIETLEKLSKAKYSGVVVLKSTVEPGTTHQLTTKFNNICLVHNPEFLSAATAFRDFHDQKHIVLGVSDTCNKIKQDVIARFYQIYYPSAEVSICTAIESESMKSFANSFYAVKIQFFNELYQMCQKSGAEYDTVKNLMLKNNWINPMHTTVPGTDGSLSYGGGCFPKDTNALLQCMRRNGVPHGVLESCIRERNDMRGESSKNCVLETATEAPEKVSELPITFDERVSKQLAIEDILKTLKKDDVIY